MSPVLKDPRNLPPAAPVRRIGVVEGVLNSLGSLAQVHTLFPDLLFESVGPVWPGALPAFLDAVIVPLAGDSPADVTEALRRLARPSDTQVIVALSNASVATTQRLARGGAADILPAPFDETALALCLGRIVSTATSARRSPTGEVIAVLKAGGGAGATTLACQAGILLAKREGARVCMADLDIQSGDAASHLDLRRPTTLNDFMSMGAALGETLFMEALAAHPSGLRLLAAPEAVGDVNALGPEQVNSLFAGLKRDFKTTLVDLPPFWTGWSTAVLSQADRVVLVTRLTVPHMQKVRRVFAFLSTLGLADLPLILVCNQVTDEQRAALSQKVAERTLGRSIDAMIPEDRRVMTAVSNQGLEIGAVQRGGKLHKSVMSLTELLSASVAARASTR